MRDALVDTSVMALEEPPSIPAVQCLAAPVFREALMQLADAGVRTCLLRDDPDAFDTLVELDVLVPRRSLKQAAMVLEAQGWEAWGPAGGDPLKLQVVIMDGRILRKIDLHGALVAGGIVYMDEDWFWARIASHAPAVNVPGPEAFVLHCILHVILSKPCLSRKYASRLQSVLGKIDRTAVLAQAHRYGLSRLVGDVLDHPFAALGKARNVRRLRKAALTALLARHPRNLARVCMSRVERALSRIKSARGGVLIAVVGPDGAGKTSFIAALQSEIESTFDFATRAAYMGPWDRPVLPTSKLLARVDASPLDDLEQPVSPRWRRRLVSRLDSAGRVRRSLYYGNLPFEMWARYLWRVKRHRMLSRVIVADRYIYDLEVGFRNVCVRNSARFRKLICHVIPRPDVTILLYNDPQVIWKRKAEYPADVIANALEKYQKISADWDFRPVRTDRSPTALAASFVSQNWRNILRLQSARQLVSKWESGSSGEARITREPSPIE